MIIVIEDNCQNLMIPTLLDFYPIDFNDDDFICIYYPECTTQPVGNVQITSYDRCSIPILNCWQDRKIVHYDTYTSTDTSELLDFDF